VDDEQRKLIEWLNSYDGRRWSQLKHRQSPNAYKMFSLKEQETADTVTDLVWVDWGWMDASGKYRKPEKNFNDRHPSIGMRRQALPIHYE
jgi:hypothetical protein